MRYLLSYSLLTLAITASHCTPDATTDPPPPRQYLVIANERGLRGGFIDQANILTLEDSTLHVASALNPNFNRRYPVRGGKIIHGTTAEEHWSIQDNESDTITLTDPVNDNKHTLLRLATVDSLPGLSDFLVGRELTQPSDAPVNRSGKVSFLFRVTPDDRHCFVVRRYTQQYYHDDEDETPEPVPLTLREQEPESWRIDRRFNQPLLVFTNDGVNHRVVLLDSLTQAPARLSGRAISSMSFKPRPWVVQPTDTVPGRHLLTELPDVSQPISDGAILAAARPKLYGRFSGSRREGNQGTSMVDLEYESLTIDIDPGGHHTISTAGRVLTEGPLRLHPTAPYLISGDGCTIDNYYAYTLAGDTLSLRIPVRVTREITDVKYESYAPGGRVEQYTFEEWLPRFLLNNHILK